MSAPAGWYPSSKREGYERYFNGKKWTSAFRLAAPEEAPPNPEDLVDTTEPVTAGVNRGANHGQWPTGGTNNQWSPDSIINTLKNAAVNKENQAIGSQAAGGALIADGIVGFGDKRAGIGGAINTIFFGLLWLFISVFLMNSLMSESEVRDHEVVVQGQVVGVDWKRSSKGNATCSPIAQFEVDGTFYNATSSVSSSPCSWDAGDTIDVIYDPNQIEESARADNSGSVKLFALLFPAIGVFIVLGGIVTFIKRAGSIGAGIYLLLHGRKKKEALQNKK